MYITSSAGLLTYFCAIAIHRVKVDLSLYHKTFEKLLNPVGWEGEVRYNANPASSSIFSCFQFVTYCVFKISLESKKDECKSSFLFLQMSTNPLQIKPRDTSCSVVIENADNPVINLYLMDYFSANIGSTGTVIANINHTAKDSFLAIWYQPTNNSIKVTFGVTNIPVITITYTHI